MKNTNTNKIALITGGTRGIGFAIAHQLASDGINCTVTGTTEEPPEGIINKFGYFKANLTREYDVNALSLYIEKIKPSVLVNNVGINIKGKTTAYSNADYDDLLSANLRAPFVLCKSALKGMEKVGWGRIVNITSLWGISGNKNNAAYCASKFGLDGLTTSIASEVAKSNILVNSVAPGYILTENAREAFSDEDLEAVSKEIPLGRLGKPEEVANLVSWLVSGQNTYMTGQNLLIDGGLTRTAHP